MSTLVDSIHYLPLATDDKYLIGNIDKLIVTDDFLYIIDKNISFSIYCFNKKGEFVRKIGNRGASNKEYVSITDVNIYNEKIYIWDGSSRKLLIYKSNGNYINSISSDYAAEAIAILNDSLARFLTYAVHGDFFYCVMEPSEILEHAKLIPASEKRKLDRLKSEDNPIIVMMQIKKQ